MKRDNFAAGWIGAALAACVSLGATQALITGFALSLEKPWLPLAVCILASLLGALCFSLPKGGRWVAAASALAAGYLWHQGDFTEQLFRLVYRISYIYNRAYHFGYLQLVDGAWNEGVADLPICVLGALTALSVARCVCRGRSLTLPTLTVLPSIAICFVVTDTAPSSASLFAVLLGFGVLMLTSLVRSADREQGGRLAAQLLIPMAAALGLLFLAVPREDYVNQSAQARERLAQLLSPKERLEVLPEMEITWTSTPQEGEKVDLASLNGQPESDTPVMTVQADVGGGLYLRGQDYDVYTGLGWEASPYRAEDFSCDGESLGVVTVQTRDCLDRLYLPYYPQRGISLVGGQVENSPLYTTYHFQRNGLSGDLYTLLSQRAEPERTPRAEYLALPEDTQAFASGILEEILTDRSSATRQAEAIGSFLRQKAAYDRQTPRMPEDETDFVQWFLTRSDRGYCVHFASAAVVLLRAAGVEARYVSGYMVKALSGEATTVIVSNAHAWAEYYEPRLDIWLPLEATPSSGSSTLPQPHAQQSQPVPETTQAAPLPTAAPASTEPVPSTAVPPTAAAPEPVQRPGPMPAVFAWLLAALVLAALLEGQRALRRALRTHRQHTGHPNAQAIARWQEVRLLAKALRQTPPRALEVLTGKAKFSQHTLTAEELGAYDTYLSAARRQLQKADPIRRLYSRYFLAVV